MKFDELAIGQRFTCSELPGGCIYRRKVEGGYIIDPLHPETPKWKLERIRDENGKIASIGAAFNETLQQATFFRGPEEVVVI